MLYLSNDEVKIFSASMGGQVRKRPSNNLFNPLSGQYYVD